MRIILSSTINAPSTQTDTAETHSPTGWNYLAVVVSSTLKVDVCMDDVCMEIKAHYFIKAYSGILDPRNISELATKCENSSCVF